jgi:tetratricopeptide (TPR) repeat protein
MEGAATSPEGGGAGIDPAAVALALGGASRDEADAFLRDQRQLSQLQIARLQAQDKHFHEEAELELSHLRLRRVGEYFKIALEGAAGLLALVAVVVLAGAAWKASQADGLVIDAFSVPPQYTQTGITGEVISQDLTDKIGAIRQLTQGPVASSQNIRKDSAEDIKVEIPETGVSLGQAWRYLRLWLGHERHLNGNLRVASDGKVTLTVALDGEKAATVSGADLGELEQQAAEQVFARSDPTNFLFYLEAHGHVGEAVAMAANLAATARTPLERGTWYTMWAGAMAGITRDPSLLMAQAKIAIAAYPKGFGGNLMALHHDVFLSHQEDQFQQASAILALKDRDQFSNTQGRGFANILREAQSRHDQAQGDFIGFVEKFCKYYCSYPATLLANAQAAALTHDFATSRALIAQAVATGNTPAEGVESARAAAAGNNPTEGVEFTRALADMAARGWQATGAYGPTLFSEGAGSGAPAYQAMQKLNFSQTRQAEAAARAGDIAGGETLIAATPLDCDGCVLVRGRIAVLKHDWAGAAHWFAMVATRSHHIPFADTDWGAMLLAHGDADGAIIKFASANQKGPHFADPLEGWGEALMAKNQSHMALAKFEEAEKYAPNWGRLHLKWGEALVYAGKKDEAKAQFVRAAALDLTPSEKSELARHP